MLKLYGSTTSPYVRRLRLWLANVEHEFINLNIFTKDDRAILAEKNPTLKIPMIEDGDTVIFDSRVIFRYLSEKFNASGLSWEQENLLTVIDAANDSLVQLLLLKRSGFNTDDDVMFFRLQKERIQGILSCLNDNVKNGDFSDWDYPSICLYALLDWIAFRSLFDTSAFLHLGAFYQAHSDREEVKATAPKE